MKMGEHMQPVVELVDSLTDGNPEKALKLLALVAVEYMLELDCTAFEVSADSMTVSVALSLGD